MTLGPAAAAGPTFDYIGANSPACSSSGVLRLIPVCTTLADPTTAVCTSLGACSPDRFLDFRGLLPTALLRPLHVEHDDRASWTLLRGEAYTPGVRGHVDRHALRFEEAADGFEAPGGGLPGKAAAELTCEIDHREGG